MGEQCRKWIDKLEREHTLSQSEFTQLIRQHTQEDSGYLFEKSSAARKRYFGNEVYIRGLIEFTNYCKNDCYYCGLRKSNQKIERYRLTKEEIVECCRQGYELGFRTFVLQGGEDGNYTAARMEELIYEIKQAFPDCALTLSLGEKSPGTYLRFRRAGADRYLLRHETADSVHYRKLHPENLSLESRMQCLQELERVGFQVGTGFMVGSPGQTAECLAKDLAYIHSINPQMVGIGPFLTHQDTPFRDCENGSMEVTLFLLGILRLMLPEALLPATTALGTIHPRGRELGIQAGANVVMPNLSPKNVRKKYLLYDNKISTGAEAAESVRDLKERMKTIGYEVVTARGDWTGRPYSQHRE